MSGKKANDPEDFARLLKLSDAHDKERFHPLAIFGILAWLVPFLGVGIGVAIAKLVPAQGGSGYEGLRILAFGIFGALIGNAIGLGLSTYAICRRERWVAIGVLALVLNGGIVLSVVLAFSR
jgi:hypothetical protein